MIPTAPCCGLAAPCLAGQPLGTSAWGCWPQRASLGPGTAKELCGGWASACSLAVAQVASVAPCHRTPWDDGPAPASPWLSVEMESLWPLAAGLLCDLGSCLESAADLRAVQVASYRVGPGGDGDIWSCVPCAVPVGRDGQQGSRSCGTWVQVAWESPDTPRPPPATALPVLQMLWPPLGEVE